MEVFVMLESCWKEQQRRLGSGPRKFRVGKRVCE